MANTAPVRFAAGFTQDFPFQPLAQLGIPNPAYYHVHHDDFDTLATGKYTATNTGNGTIALTAGDGGQLLFTTNSSTPAAGDVSSLQIGAASFTYSAGKKLAFECRVKLSSVTNNEMIVGLIQTTSTPFTVTDGIYFFKATGAQTLVLRSTNTSVNTDIALPAAVSAALADATFVDLAFYADGKGNLMAFVDTQLVGFIPQSGVGSSTPRRGAVASGAPSFTTATLNPTLALKSGTASSKTMTVDFITVAKER